MQSLFIYDWFCGPGSRVHEAVIMEDWVSLVCHQLPAEDWMHVAVWGDAVCAGDHEAQGGAGGDGLWGWVQTTTDRCCLTPFCS